MSRNIFTLGLLFLITASGCGRSSDSKPKLNLLISGIDFGEYDGLNVFTSLRELPGGEIPDESSAVIDDSGWEIFYKAILVQGIRYELTYFVDANQNGLCNEPPDEPGWTTIIEDITGQVNLEVNSAAEQSDPCEPFQAP